MSELNNKYKRVLVIAGHNLSGNTSDDITLRSYFEQWPRENIIIITPTYTDQPFATTVFLHSKLFERAKRYAQKIFLTKQKGSDTRNVVPGAIINEQNNHLSLKNKIFAIGAAYADSIQFSLSIDTIKVIDNFKPEVIYTVMGGIRLIKLANQLSQKYNIPIVPHFMDDWVSSIYTGSIWMQIPRQVLLHSLNRLLIRSKVGLGISSKMCNEYENKFHKKFYPLMNTINLEYFTNNKKIPKNETDKLVFTYLGGLHVNRWQSLLMLSDILNSLSQSLGILLILEIYTSQEHINKFAHKFDNSKVILKKAINHQAAILKMIQTDFLVHVESFDDSVIKFTRLSISTKIPEYLASGTPIIAIGPSNIASMEYLINNECGYIGTNLDFNELKSMVMAAIKGENNDLYKENNFKLVKENHSSSQLKLLHNILINSKRTDNEYKLEKQ